MNKEKFIKLICNDCICYKTRVNTWSDKQEECMGSIVMAGNGNFFDNRDTYSDSKINKIIEQMT